MKRKVFHLVTTLDAGNVEKHLLTLLWRLDRERWDVSVGYLKGAGQWAGRFRDLPIAVTDFRMRPVGGFLGHRRLEAHLKRLRPDVVHTHLPGAHVHGGTAGRDTGVPVTIASIHEDFALGRSAPIRRAFAAADAIVTASHALAHRLQRSNPASAAKIRRVPYGIDVEAHERSGRSNELHRGLGLPDAVKLVVSIERRGSRSYPEVMVHAAARLHHQFPEVMFLLVGHAGRAERRLRRLIRRRRLSHTVLTTRRLRDETAALTEADILVLATSQESSAVQLLEAMAAGLPVVCARSGAAADIMLDEATGMVLDPFDAETLAAALSRLLSAPELGRLMGRTARVRATEDFSARTMAHAVERLYDELLGSTS